MADEIQDADTRVTPSFHPQTVRAIDGYDEDTSGVLAGTEAAFNDAYIGVGRVHDAREAGKRNPAWTPENALIQTQDFADKLTMQLAKRFDGATANLNRVIEGLERDLSQPLTGHGVGGMSAEIRAFVKALPDGQQMAFIRNAIEQGDERTCGAVLGGVAYLSGITPEVQAVLLKLYHEKANPRAAKQLRAAKAGLELLGERSALIFKEMERAVGAPQAKVQQLRAAKAAAEKSFVV
ncbi:hypothetical protein N5J77_28595 [Sphingobium yanoikuyae]|uniref:Uncharacterized protein n=1 Tax=Sphingobium yanoikuyae TaxID=13690 RepID=A0AA43BE83_SPHYA|nr:hypothetical protein [Sphingobium yanoikuyae]MDH2135090.1 hypothetical protein [Sphingobium yanoikuyae]MDH2169617.1 hypothetical protein [Sphingobium yanoikuyae]